MKSSFVRKGKAAASAPALPEGTRLSPHNGALLLSSGLADLDDIFSGGLTVGSLLLIEEDVFSDYAQLLPRYFAAEAVACKQQLYVASISTEESAAEKWVRKLPFVSAPPPSQTTPSEPQAAPPADIEANNDIKIAWQYKKYLGGDKDAPLGAAASKRLSWCHSFDMMKTMEAKYIGEAEISSTSFMTATGPEDCYKHVYDKLIRLVQANNELLAKEGKAKVSRLCLPSLGSAFYGVKYESEATHKKMLLQFLRALRGLLRQSLATCVITFPSHLYGNDPNFVQRMRHSADAVVKFSAFSDSADPVSPAFFDYDGLFTVLKVPRIASLSSLMPAQPTFTFQFKRKKLSIEKIHLPPDMSILDEKKAAPTAAQLCAPGPSKSSSLDF